MKRMLRLATIAACLLVPVAVSLTSHNYATAQAPQPTPSPTPEPPVGVTVQFSAPQPSTAGKPSGNPPVLKSIYFETSNTLYLKDLGDHEGLIINSDSTIECDGGEINYIGPSYSQFNAAATNGKFFLSYTAKGTKDLATERSLSATGKSHWYVSRQTDAPGSSPDHQQGTASVNFYTGKSPAQPPIGG